MASEAARFVVFGEALTDFIREGEDRWRSAPGGAPWNVARVAARMGVPTGFAGGLSQDAFGEELLGLSLAAGLDARFLQRVHEPTLLAMVLSRDPPRYFFVGDCSAEVAYDPDRLPAAWLEQVEVVYFGSIALLRPPLGERLLELADRVHAAGKLICFDPNYRSMAAQGYRPTVERLARIADYIKVSDEDLAGLMPGRSTDEGLRALQSLAPGAQILFTRGPKGMTLLTPAEALDQPVYPVPVVDTVGAGDACVGAWMASLLLRPGASLREHVAWAAAAAAVSCGHAGAYPPLRGEVEAVCGAAAAPGSAPRRTRLQLAIDTLQLAEAEALLARVHDLIDIVEVGTPVLLRDGVAAVRRLHASFPELTLLADLKIADGGHLEATLGFQAGARIVTVLASAADATIREAVRAAGECGGEVMVDLMGVSDLLGRAIEVERLGARHVCLHTPTDLQSADGEAERRGVEGISRVGNVLQMARIAVAGGISPASAPGIAALRPDILVVGSGITRAADPRAAALAIRTALDAEQRT